MLTKLQKKEHVAIGTKAIGESKSLIFADFTGAPTKDINHLKTELRKSGATFKVIKKRLLRIALKDAGIEFDPMQFKAPVATIFVKGDITSVAAQVYKFSRELAKKKIDFKIVSAYDKDRKATVSAAEFLVIAKLPSREVLLGMVLGAMTGPLRAFMYILSELSKKQPAAAPSTATAPEEKKVETPEAPKA